MSITYSTSDITHARPYWLERTPYNTVIDSIAAGATQNVFSVNGWNTAPGSSNMVAELYSLGITQYPQLQVAITYDGNTDRFFADDFPMALQQLRMGHSARSNLVVNLTNNGTTTLTNVQVQYVCQSWRSPPSYKILQGYALTAAEKTVALGAGLGLNPNQDEGLFPIPLESVIDRSYKNRRTEPWVRFANDITLGAAGVGQVIDQVQAMPNELLVVTDVGVDADFDDGGTFSVDRDNDATHIQLDADQLSVNDPLDMWVPALNHLTFHYESTLLPAAAVPIRFGILHVSLDLILDLRMGLLSTDQVASVLQRNFVSRGMSAKDAASKASSSATYLVTGVSAGVR